MKPRLSDALCNSITVAVASRYATRFCERRRKRGSAFEFRLACIALRISAHSPAVQIRAHSIASRFVDRAARDGPSEAMNRRQTDVDGLADCHAGVMKPPDRRFWRLHRPIRRMLRRNIIAIHSKNSISDYF
jgi:hypothetical protein